MRSRNADHSTATFGWTVRQTDTISAYCVQKKLQCVCTRLSVCVSLNGAFRIETVQRQTEDDT
jgi:hypothetical protein